MSERVIPLVDQRIASLTAPVPAQPIVADGLLSDALGRPLNDLRISVTDRCNFRCNYCMPKEVFDKDHAYLPHNALLSFEEITRLARLFMAHGVRNISGIRGFNSPRSMPSAAACTLVSEIPSGLRPNLSP